MAVIADRSEGNEKRKDRLAKIKKGPGVFVYGGEAYDTEAVPTQLKVGKNVPLLDQDGMPVTDRSGRPMFERAGRVVQDSKGQPVLGGEPIIKRKRITTYKLRGLEFPEGVAVEVSDAAVALKLRCLGLFEELEGEAAAEATKDAAPEAKKRGRKPKFDAEAGAALEAKD
jgi:hypothetical protein